MQLNEREIRITALTVGIAIFAGTLQWIVVPNAGKIISVSSEIFQAQQSLEQLRQVQDVPKLLSQAVPRPALTQRSAPSGPFEKISRQVKLAGLLLRTAEWSSAEGNSLLSLQLEGGYKELTTLLDDLSHESPILSPVYVEMRPLHEGEPGTLQIGIQLK